MKMFKALAVCLLLLISTAAMAETELKVPSKDLEADYGRVWDAAIDALYESGIPISYMSRADGYLVTDKKTLRAEQTISGASGYRVWVTLRFAKKNGLISILIRTDAEKMFWYKSSEPNYPPFDVWRPDGSDEGLEKLLKDKISSRL